MRVEWLAYSGAVAGCGMSVHIEVTHRALVNLPSKYDNYHGAINRNLQAVEAGSFFPDWGYNCFKMGEASEAAHWPTFYLNAVSYIQQTYPNQLSALRRGLQGDARFEKLLAFLFGVVSHGTADITWHSLDSNTQGLIDASGKRDWGGSYGKAHTVADTGAEFVLARANDLDYVQRVWTIPLEDILAIYKRMGVENVTSTKLVSCMAIGYSAVQGVRIAGKRILGRFDTDKSPFLLMNYESYFRGGLMNMASWVGFCWGELISWLETEGPRRGFCKLQFPKYADVTISQPERPLNLMSDDPIKENDVNKEHEGIAQLLLDQLSSEVKEPLNRRAEQECRTLPKQIKMETILPPISTPYSLFGNTLVHYNKYILVSAPYHASAGAVFIYEFPQPKLVGTLKGPPSHATDSRFGEDIAILDYFGNGIEDVLVGAPSHSTQDRVHAGAIHVYSEHALKTTITPPSFMLNQVSDKGYLLFGERLLVADLNGDNRADLVVGSPGFSGVGLEQSGVLCTYLSLPKGGFLKEPHWCTLSPSPHNHEGFSTQLQFISQEKSLLIGAPGHKLDSSRVGCIYKLSLNEMGFPESLPIPVLFGNQPGMQLGTRFVYSNEHLVVSAPTLSTEVSWLAGGLYKVNVSKFHEPWLLNPNPLVSKSKGGLMGSSILHAHHPSLSGVFVSEPLAEWEQGQVTFIPSNSSKPPICFRSNIDRTRFGWAMALADLDGDGKLDLAISSPHHNSADHPEAGKVTILYNVESKWMSFAPRALPCLCLIFISLIFAIL